MCVRLRFFWVALLAAPLLAGCIEGKKRTASGDGGAGEAGIDGTTDGDGANPDGALPDGGRTLGQPCDSATQCEGGVCEGGVCCDSECAGPCRQCSAEGVCTLTPSGDDPDGDCLGGGSPGCAGTCDGDGGCTYPDDAVSCGTPSCVDAKLTTGLCDGAGGCAETTSICNGYECADTATCGTKCVDPGDCVSPFTCSPDGKCKAELPLGDECGTNDDACLGGKCVDGYCCNTDCADECKACDVAGSLGTCTPVADDTFCGVTSCSGSTLTEHACQGGTCQGKTTSCVPYTCNAGGTGCRTSCGGDGDCAGAAYCDGVTCVGKKADGQGCSTGPECASGKCVDKYCCNADCAGECEGCDVAGHLGSCTPRPSGTPCGNGDKTCVDDSSGSELHTVACDGASASCGTVVTVCTPYNCDSGTETCMTSCASSGDCAPAFTCAGTACTADLPNGGSCGSDGDLCQSGNCVDGVCCAATSCPACQGCDHNGLGTCSDDGDGTVDPACGGQSCTSGTQTDFTCEGGGCTPHTLDCGNYACVGTVCAGDCTVANQDTNCGDGMFCNATSDCTPKLDAGWACEEPYECQTGNCVDAVCCNDAACPADSCTGGIRSYYECDPSSGDCTAITGDCGYYACNGTICGKTCDPAAQTGCLSTAYCDASGVCVAKKPVSSSCANDYECVNGNCPDGKCRCDPGEETSIDINGNVTPDCLENMLSGGQFPTSAALSDWPKFTHASSSWSSEDADGSGTSGSLIATNGVTSGVQSFTGVYQCIAVASSTQYAVWVMANVTPHLSSPWAAIKVVHFNDKSCTPGTATDEHESNHTTAYNTWQELGVQFDTGPTDKAVQVFLGVTKDPSTGAVHANFDNALMRTK